MSKPNFSADFPEATIRQIEELKPLFNGNKTQIVIRAISELHRKEIGMIRQSAEQKIREMLKEVYEEGDVNAAEIFKGFAIDTGKSGWHLRFFDRSDHIYLGANITEVELYLDDIASERAYQRGEIAAWDAQRQQANQDAGHYAE